MSVSDLFEPLTLLRGRAMQNRLMLAPLTNRQSLPDGSASHYDIEWMRLLGEGGYSLIHTCAATILAGGRAFPGQLGIHDDAQIPGLSKMAAEARRQGALTSVQLHHGGFRVMPELGGVPLPVSDGLSDTTGAMTLEQIDSIRTSFVEAAVRAEKAGFDGVALHGAFAFMLSQFLSPEMNQRTDAYGGSLENRSRLIFETIDAIRAATGSDFQLGIRLSVERFGLRVEEIRDLAGELMRLAKIDYIDLALWDSAQIVQDGPEEGKKALDLFTALPRNGVRLGTAGKIMSAHRAGELLEEGCDFVLIGRAACLHPDMPNRIIQDHSYRAPELPVTGKFLADQGISPPLIEYLRTWPNLVQN